MSTEPVDYTPGEQAKRLREMRRKAQRSHLKRIAASGGKATAAKRKADRGDIPPYSGTFLEFRDAIGRGGVSRSLWDVLWRAVDGLPLTTEQLAAFTLHTGRQAAPTGPCRELWMPAGRRGGKSENIMLRETYRAISRKWKDVLAPGEIGTIPVIASDRDQARNSLRYLKGLAADPIVAPYVATIKRDSVEFRTGAIVQVHTANWRATRGYTMLDVVLEECAFYASDDSANPDEEILAAIRPALLTVPDARVYGVSSPYAARGILYDAWREHWGQDGDEVLVFSADTLSLNPTVPERVIVKEWETDPARAASEYGREGLVTFRADVEAFLSREAVHAVVIPNRRELPPRLDVHYLAHVDPSGGSQDSYTLAVVHYENPSVVVDCIRETRPPFSPEAVTGEYAKVLKEYRVRDVTGDKYAGEFPRELFRKAGIEYKTSSLTTSDYYLDLLPIINAGRVQLLDLPRLLAQLIGLERHVGRTGKDSVSHVRGAHDDVASAVAGAVLRAAKAVGTGEIVAPIQLLGPSKWRGGGGDQGVMPDHWTGGPPGNDGFARRGPFDF